ncbi:Ricin B-like lectins domain-containing protein, partial [Dioscorea alata]
IQVIILAVTCVHAKSDKKLTSKLLCSQCSACDVSKCPASDAYPHMTAYDDSLIAGSLQSDFVSFKDRRVYAVPNIRGGESENYNAYYGWQSTTGSASGYHRFSNYMDKCSGQNYLTVDEHGVVELRSLHLLEDLGQADWKSVNPPPKYNHRNFRFWVNRSTGKCLTVFGGKKQKRTVGVAKCKFNGSKLSQLFAFRFHYHKAFCCCGLHND